MTGGIVAVHTGAGNCIDKQKYRTINKEACQQGVAVLRSGGSCMEACVAAICALENCGLTNAGYGSNLTWDGRIECEASIMNGRTLEFGACTNTTTIPNPIRVAKEICDRQSRLLRFDRIPPMILSGDGAATFAKSCGIELVDPDTMISARALKSYEHYTGKVDQYGQRNNITVEPFDTVGAVCLDAYGNCVAGCSSGGLLLKLPGRIGQSATYGAGCWARTTDERSVATCTTGNGEYLMKTLLAKEIVDDLLRSRDPVRSISKTFERKFLQSPFVANVKELFGGALSIVYDPKHGDGEVFWSHTSEAFALSYMTTVARKATYVFSSLPHGSKAGLSTTVSGQHFKLNI